MYQAAEKIINHNVFPSVTFISSLQRSIDSNNILLQHLNNPSRDIHQSWRLNERHYGLLTGHNKSTYNWKGGYFDMPPLVDSDYDDDFTGGELEFTDGTIVHPSVGKCVLFDAQAHDAA
jgi:hypothetical protein